MLPIGEFRQPRSGPLMLLFANSLDGVRGGLVSGIQPAMGGLEGISRVGRTLGTPDAHPNLKEEPLWGQPPPAVRRSAAPLTVQHSCPPSPKKLRWRTGVPARQGSSTRVLPKFPSRHHEPHRGWAPRPPSRAQLRNSWDCHPGRARLRSEGSADKSPKPLQKHGKSGVTTPTTNLLKMVFCNCAYVPLAGIRM